MQGNTPMMLKTLANVKIALVAFLLSSQTLAGQIEYLAVEDNHIVFVVSQSKPEAPPDCVLQESSELWSMSLSNSKGKASHSLLVTAAAEGLNIEVESAGDCADINGVERAQRIRLVK